METQLSGSWQDWLGVAGSVIVSAESKIWSRLHRGISNC